MPLSEHEQRLLDEMERNLYQHDADFVSSVSGVKFRPNYAAIVWGSLLTLLGMAAILVGVMLHLVIVGVLGFVAAVAGVLLMTRRGSGASAARARARTRSSLMDRVNDRWDNRQQS